jgi:hypothetical protein
MFRGFPEEIIDEVEKDIAYEMTHLNLKNVSFIFFALREDYESNSKSGTDFLVNTFMKKL